MIVRGPTPFWHVRPAEYTRCTKCYFQQLTEVVVVWSLPGEILIIPVASTIRHPNSNNELTGKTGEEHVPYLSGKDCGNIDLDLKPGGKG